MSDDDDDDDRIGEFDCGLTTCTEWTLLVGRSVGRMCARAREWFQCQLVGCGHPRFHSSTRPFLPTTAEDVDAAAAMQVSVSLQYFLVCSLCSIILFCFFLRRRRRLFRCPSKTEYFEKGGSKHDGK